MLLSIFGQEAGLAQILTMFGRFLKNLGSQWILPERVDDPNRFRLATGDEKSVNVVEGVLKIRCRFSPETNRRGNHMRHSFGHQGFEPLLVTVFGIVLPSHTDQARR